MFNKPLGSLSSKLAKEYGLDELGCQIMSAYLKLNDEDRLAVGRLIQNIIDERIARSPLSAADQAKPIDQHAAWEAEARAAADQVYREVLPEKKAEASFSASPSGSAEGTKGA